MSYVDVEGMQRAASNMSGAAEVMRSAASSMWEHMQTLSQNVSYFGDHVRQMHECVESQRVMQDRQVKIEVIRGKMEVVRFGVIVMQAENFTRMNSGSSPAYGEDAFLDSAKEMQRLAKELEDL